MTVLDQVRYLALLPLFESLIMDNNLFTKANFDSLEMDFDRRVKTIVESFVMIDGLEYEVADLYETCEMVADGDAYVNEKHMADMLVKYGVLASAGSRSWAGSKGPNYDAFMKKLSDHT